MHSFYKRVIFTLFAFLLPGLLVAGQFNYGYYTFDIKKVGSGNIEGDAKLISSRTTPPYQLNLFGYALNYKDVYRLISIGDEAFMNQPAINTLVIYPPIQSICRKAFSGCWKLNTIKFPTSLTDIGDYAFKDCTSLESVTLPTALSTLGVGAFYGCVKLAEISIPRSLKKINASAFEGCSLRKIEYLTDSPIEGEDNTFSDFVYQTATLVVAPGGYYNAHETAPWANFTNIVEKGQAVDSIQIDKRKINVDLEGKVNLKATYYPVYAESAHISWRSSNRSVATVDANGLVTTLKPGSAIITAYIGTVTASCEVTVSEFPADNVFVSNGICYQITSRENMTAVVTRPTAKKGQTCTYKGDIRIPARAIGYNKTYKVTSIASNAFEDCHNVTGIEIDNEITSIDAEAFKGCENLTHINIPLSVTEIGRAAFKGCRSLSKVDLPTSITVLHESLFMLSGLERFTVPNSVTRIEGAVFDRCENLKELLINENCEELGGSIINGCKSLTQLVIPPNVKKIGYGAFYGVPELPSITYLTSQPVDGEGTIFDLKTLLNTTLFIKPEALASFKATRYWNEFDHFASFGVPTSSVDIDRESVALNLTKTVQLHSATYPELCEDKHVTWSTEDCSIATVSSSGLVTAIGSGRVNIIASCAGVTDTCSVTVKPKTYDFMVNDIAYNITSEDAHTVEVAYYDEYMGDLVIPQTVHYNNNTYTVTALIPGAFKDLCYVQSVELPETITTISKEAFAHCINLTSVTLGSSTNVFEEAAFKLSNALRSISFRKTNSELKTLAAGSTASHGSIGKEAFDNCCTLQSFEVPASIVEIGDKAFNQCYSLKEIKFPSILTSIGDEAFKDCTHVTSIKLPEQVNSIGEKTFMGCSTLKDVTLPSNLSEISTSMFEYCEALTNVNIPDSLSEIGDRAFFRCTKLPSLQYPSQLQSIGEMAFAFCSNVTSLPLPESLKTINRGAFLNCQQVKDIHVPSNIQSIGDGAFMTLSQIEKIEYLSPQLHLSKITREAMKGQEAGIFDDETYNEATLVVNVNERIPTMQTNTWGKFKHIVENGTLVTSIQLTPDEWEGSAGDAFTISAKVFPANASNKSVIFTSSDEDVAIVDDAGNVTIVNDGTCTITVEAADGSEVKSECLIYCATAAETVPTDLINSTIDVYDLKGQEVLRNADSSLLKSLSPGTYIIDNNGKRSKLFLR